MKVKLLRKISRLAKNCAHINSLTYIYHPYSVTNWSASVGYATENDKDTYGDILSYGMDENTFDRLVRQRYWELNKQLFYNKYKKD